MRLLSLIIIPIGLLIELLAVWAFIAGWHAPVGLITLLLAHLIGCAVLIVGVYLALPPVYKRPLGGGFLFLATASVLTPPLGAIGLVLGMLPGLYFAYREKPQAWDALAIPDLPFQPVTVDPDDVFMRDGLASVLTHFDDRNRRQQAIMACRHLPRRDAVPILRSGLSDKADEVRLLAYAMLNSIERDLEGQLNAVRDAIAASGDVDGDLHEERALLFWEFSYLQLAKGSVEELMLTKSRDAVDIALERQATAQRWLIRARISMALKEYDAAESALRHAEQLGLSTDDAAPRWAELAFKRGDYADVAPALRRVSARGANNPVMRPLMEYWL